MRTQRIVEGIRAMAMFALYVHWPMERRVIQDVNVLLAFAQIRLERGVGLGEPLQLTTDQGEPEENSVVSLPSEGIRPEII